MCRRNILHVVWESHKENAMRGSMRWMAAGLVLAMSACVSGSVQQKEAPTAMKKRPPLPRESRMRVAVADFEDKSGYGREQVGRPAADILATMLVDCDQFRVYERQKLSAALDELKLGQSGVVDPTTAQKVGKQIGVEYVFYGVVSKVAFRRERTNVIIAQKVAQIADVTVMCRMIHVESGEIIFAKEGDGMADRVASGSLGLGGSMSYDSGLFADALRAAIYKMLDEMIDKAEASR
jgi:curli biogenesis system outer membrane secretion channel CsgG